MTATAALSPFQQQEIDREFRVAIQHTQAPTVEVQIARALFDLGIIPAAPRNIAWALGAAARLEAGYLSASLIRRNYGAGQLTHELVTAAVAAAA